MGTSGSVDAVGSGRAWSMLTGTFCQELGIRSEWWVECAVCSAPAHGGGAPDGEARLSTETCATARFWIPAGRFDAETCTTARFRTARASFHAETCATAHFQTARVRFHAKTCVTSTLQRTWGSLRTNEPLPGKFQRRETPFGVTTCLKTGFNEAHSWKRPLKYSQEREQAPAPKDDGHSHRSCWKPTAPTQDADLPAPLRRTERKG